MIFRMLSDSRYSVGDTPALRVKPSRSRVAPPRNQNRSGGEFEYCRWKVRLFQRRHGSRGFLAAKARGIWFLLLCGNRRYRLVLKTMFVISEEVSLYAKIRIETCP
ncbi:unnamed protein product [Nesidiocoris tenuis]|uniref:Uncharacterized protein n=1 Tax=Nesidiocoris tenuis TaxID=355587 RepID=A0A6H5GTD0_9HEMI|nr:unnamed protein product [Nesidiocoris tenuis]